MEQRVEQYRGEQDGPGRQGVLDLELVPSPVAARQARKGLRAVVGDSPCALRLEDAELTLSELVTNAVLHGRQPLSLRVSVTDRTLRIEVRDASPQLPSFSMLDPTAVTGRGLLLVATLADRWGLEPLCAGGKAIWVEFDAVAEPAAALEVDELLASWGEDLDDPAHEVVKVVLTELDVALTARSEAHVEALLRELSLVSGQRRPPGDADLAVVAGRVVQAAAAVDALRAEMKHQLSRAVAHRRTQVDVVLRVTRVDAETVRRFARAVDDADRLSRGGRLLTEPAPYALSEARARYLQRLVAQLEV